MPQVAKDVAGSRDVLFLGRGIMYPIALEGALKLKEISYIHAEGYAAGELKHGPIALIDENVPVLVLAPRDDLYEKTISNMEEVAARGGKIILMTDEATAAQHNSGKTFHCISMPKVHPFIDPLVYALAGAAAGLSRRRADGHRRGPAAQPGEDRHCRVTPKAWLLPHAALAFRAECPK